MYHNIKNIFRKYHYLILAFAAALVIAAGCTNPFAPKLAEDGDTGNVLTDQTTIDGLFQNFRYSYIFRDTVIYGNLLHEDFTFVFKNYDKDEITESWGREEDMLSTNKLFNAAQNLDLIWNEVIISVGDSLRKEIDRGFSLTVVFNTNDMISVEGKAKFVLQRTEADDPWKIIKWIDDI